MQRTDRLTSYQDLIVWQKAMDLVVDVYEATRSWPDEERFGRTSQVRRGAVSVVSNIAEGEGRTGTREFLHSLSLARGSLLEVEPQLTIAQRLGYFGDTTGAKLLQRTEEVGRLLLGSIKSLRGSTARQ